MGISYQIYYINCNYFKVCRELSHLRIQKAAEPTVRRGKKGDLGIAAL